MMKKRPRSLAAMTAFLLASIGILVISTSAYRVVKAGGPSRNAKANPKQSSNKAVMPFSPIPRPELLAPPDPATVYTVEPIPVRGIVKPRSAQEERDVVAASAIIAKLKPIPNDRIQFFGWMNEPDSPAVFLGWSVFVQQSVPTSEGQLITLRVSTQSMRKDNIMMHVMNNFLEEYLWTGGRLQYLRGYTCPIIGAKPVYSRL